MTDANRRITNVVTRNLRSDPRPLHRPADNGRREGHVPGSAAFQEGPRHGGAFAESAAVLAWRFGAPEWDRSAGPASARLA